MSWTAPILLKMPALFVELSIEMGEDPSDDLVLRADSSVSIQDWKWAVNTSDSLFNLTSM